MSILPDGFFERNDGKSYVDPEQQELARKVINSFPVYPRSYDRPFVGDASLGADGALLCFCGDPRSDHPDDGPCRLNGRGQRWLVVLCGLGNRDSVSSLKALRLGDKL